MTNSKLWLGGILVILAAACVWASLDWRPETATGAPLAQATATNTVAPTATPTNTPTPGPAVASLGGVPIYAPHAPGGNNLLGVSVEGGVISLVVTVVPAVGYTTPVVSVATVGATPGLTPVVASNSARAYLYCTNDNATSPIYLKPGGTPVVGSGIRLNASGGTYEMKRGEGTLYTGPLFAVATQTTASLVCMEGSN